MILEEGLSLYEILSLCVTAFGSIATFTAVIVALWQTKHLERKKIKCEFNYNTILVAVEGGKKEYVAMNITNIGNKKVIIDNWGIKAINGYIMILTCGCEKDEYDRRVAVKTPYILNQEEHVSFYYARNMFLDVLKNEIAKGNINENKKIKFYVTDSTGKLYIVKSGLKAKEYLE